jgi:hypothetical protein
VEWGAHPDERPLKHCNLLAPFMGGAALVDIVYIVA